ncbi:MAG: hypothetical protein MZV64_22510 [Ignavibacteriales bacterium]|nr:hypothetical protein [Ignavibacteriales bacterium]
MVQVVKTIGCLNLLVRVIKFDDFSFGLGFGQKYNGSLDFDPIPITTSQYPDGTGEYFHS